MSEKIVETEAFRQALSVAAEAGTSKIDLADLFGHHSPLYVEVGGLDSVLLDHKAPDVSLHWDGDKTITVKQTDGGVMATFELEF